MCWGGSAGAVRPWLAEKGQACPSSRSLPVSVTWRTRLRQHLHKPLLTEEASFTWTSDCSKDCHLVALRLADKRFPFLSHTTSHTWPKHHPPSIFHRLNPHAPSVPVHCQMCPGPAVLKMGGRCLTLPGPQSQSRWTGPHSPESEERSFAF